MWVRTCCCFSIGRLVKKPNSANSWWNSRLSMPPLPSWSCFLNMVWIFSCAAATRLAPVPLRVRRGNQAAGLTCSAWLLAGGTGAALALPGVASNCSMRCRLPLVLPDFLMTEAFTSSWPFWYKVFSGT